MTVDATVDTLTLTLARLETVLDQMEGLRGATVGNKQDVSTAELPHCVIVWGPSVIDLEQSTEDLLVATREYSLLILGMSWAMGVELESGEVCQPFPGRLEQLLWTNPGLHTFEADGTPKIDQRSPVMKALYTGDTGLIQIILGQWSFAGIRAFVEVETWQDLTQGT
jgi:hypothetical protein